MKKFGNGANLGLTSGVLATLGLSSLRRGSTAVPSPARAARGGAGGAGGAGGGGGGQAAAAARHAAERLAEERERLYVELKVRAQPGGGGGVKIFWARRMGGRDGGWEGGESNTCPSRNTLLCTRNREAG